jgi:cytoskeletal protein RodZ
LEDAQTEEVAFPLAWLIIGGLAGLIVIGLIGLGVVNIFRQQSITPTPQQLPPLVEPADLPPAEAATSVAAEPAQPDTGSETDEQAAEGAEPATDTETGEVTETPAEETAAEQQEVSPISVDGYVRVIGTDGAGVSLRAGPGRNNARVLVAEENEETVLLVLDGPSEDEGGEDYIWWFVRDPSGTEGWVAEDFIVSAPPPQ